MAILVGVSSSSHDTKKKVAITKNSDLKMEFVFIVKFFSKLNKNQTKRHP
jgi:hypothetical protein